MGDLFDYLVWRGDIRFSQLPPNGVDALIFSALSYVDFDDIVPDQINLSIPFCDAVKQIFELDNLDNRFRVKKDMELLRAAAQTERFGQVDLCYYQNVFVPEEETQFAAITYLLDDGSAFLTFRGTDKTLIGWKEDFNMSFQESVPAQRLAKHYVEAFAQASLRPLHIGGHSKGGNLAMYASSKVDTDIQERILDIYNQDGPGFRDKMLEDAGYLRMIPKMHTYVPQSSIFGMLMEHKEPCTIIKSRYVGIMQHDPYNWEVLGKDFIILEEMTPDSVFLDQTFDEWFNSMSEEECNSFVDSLFQLLMTPEINRPRDLLKPQNVFNYVKELHVDEERRKVIGNELMKLIEAAKHNVGKAILPKE